MRAVLDCHVSVSYTKGQAGDLEGRGGVTDDRWEGLKSGLGLTVPAGEVKAAAAVSLSDLLIEMQVHGLSI